MRRATPIRWSLGCTAIRSSEFEIDRVMSKLSLRNYVALALRGTQVSKSQKRLYDWSHSAHCVALTEECLFESIDRISESMSVHPERIFLAGMAARGDSGSAYWSSPSGSLCWRCFDQWSLSQYAQVPYSLEGSKEPSDPLDARQRSAVVGPTSWPTCSRRSIRLLSRSSQCSLHRVTNLTPKC